MSKRNKNSHDRIGIRSSLYCIKIENYGSYSRFHDFPYWPNKTTTLSFIETEMCYVPGFFFLLELNKYYETLIKDALEVEAMVGLETVTWCCSSLLVLRICS